MVIEGNQLRGILVNETEQLDAEIAVLAIGHRARDTFQMLYDHNILMQAKSFEMCIRDRSKRELEKKFKRIV